MLVLTSPLTMATLPDALLGREDPTHMDPVHPLMPTEGHIFLHLPLTIVFLQDRHPRTRAVLQMWTHIFPVIPLPVATNLHHQDVEDLASLITEIGIVTGQARLEAVEIGIVQIATILLVQISDAQEAEVPIVRGARDCRIESVTFTGDNDPERSAPQQEFTLPTIPSSGYSTASSFAIDGFLICIFGFQGSFSAAFSCGSGLGKTHGHG